MVITHHTNVFPDKFLTCPRVANQVKSAALALRTGAEGKPVQSAESAIRKFATRELGKAAMIASLED